MGEEMMAMNTDMGGTAKSHKLLNQCIVIKYYQTIGCHILKSKLMFMWIVNETKNKKDEYHENVAVLRWKSLTDSAVLFLDYCIIR